MRLNQQFADNCVTASSGKHKITSADQLVTPGEYAKTHAIAEVAQTYLDKTQFLKLFTIDLPFAIPEETRFSGHWILAAQGRGKTTLLHPMIMEDLKKGCVRHPY